MKDVTASDGDAAATAGLTAAVVDFSSRAGTAAVSTAAGVFTTAAVGVVGIDELSAADWSPVAGVTVVAVAVVAVVAGVVVAGVVVVVAPVAADEGLGVADDCLAEGRVRADRAVVVARVDVEEGPALLAELALDPESGEPPSVAADATP
ncbi:hypothetical protein AB4879_05760 [Mycobacterium sp. SA01]